MPNVVNPDLPRGVVDLVDDSIIADPKTMKPLGAGKLDGSSWEWRVAQTLDPFENTPSQIQGKVSKISLDRRFDPDLITGHRTSSASGAPRG
jgi:hypothetical protein